ncbi:MAG: translation initiation factor IF-3 [Planctomycetota bacterium]
MPGELRINHQIRVPMVRLIDAESKQVGIVPTEQARAMALETGVDLVEVAPDAKPPVCRLMDYGKFKYRQKKRTQKSRVKHTAQVKEVRLRPKTEEHDVQVKLKRAREFLEKKDRVLVNMQFRGREAAHMELGKSVMDQFIQELADLSRPDRPVRVEGRRMSVTLLPKA